MSKGLCALWRKLSIASTVGMLVIADLWSPPTSCAWTFRLHVRCIFNASDFLPIQASIFSPQPPAPVIQSGPLRLELRIATGTVPQPHPTCYFPFLPLTPLYTVCPRLTSPSLCR